MDSSIACIKVTQVTWAFGPLGCICSSGKADVTQDVSSMRLGHASLDIRSPLSADPQGLSDLIGAIYDCALQPSNWRLVLDTIIERFVFASAVLDIVRPDSATSSVQVVAGIDTEYFTLFGHYIADSIEMWGGRAVLETWPLEEPAVANQIIPIERKRKNRYFIDVLAPRGFTDGVVLPLARDKNLFCYLGLNRHVSFGDVTPDVVDGLRLLAPHLRRAVTISNLLDLHAVERATFASVLDAMTSGVVLVGEDLDILHANPAAGAMLSKGTVVADRQGRLQARGPHAQMAMTAAVKIAAQDETKLTRRGIGVPAQGLGGEASVLHVMPLTGGNIRPGLFQRAVAAVFVSPVDRPLQAPIDAMALLYDLTPAESKVLASLSQGHSLAETAAALGVANSTVKTHVLRIFDKTGRNSQAQLVALAAQHALNV